MRIGLWCIDALGVVQSRVCPAPFSRRREARRGTMSAAAFVERLFRLPGDCRAGTTHLLAQAAAMHGRLCSAAPSGRPNGREDPLPALLGYLKGQAAAADKRRLLDDPLLVEALHALASASPA